MSVTVKMILIGFLAIAFATACAVRNEHARRGWVRAGRTKYKDRLRLGFLYLSLISLGNLFLASRKGVSIPLALAIAAPLTIVFVALGLRRLSARLRGAVYLDNTVDVPYLEFFVKGFVKALAWLFLVSIVLTVVPYFVYLDPSSVVVAVLVAGLGLLRRNARLRSAAGAAPKRAHPYQSRRRGVRRGRRRPARTTDGLSGVQGPTQGLGRDPPRGTSPA